MKHSIKRVSFRVAKTVIADDLSQWYNVIDIYVCMCWCVYLRLLNNTVRVCLIVREWCCRCSIIICLCVLYVCLYNAYISCRGWLVLICALVEAKECHTPWPTIAVLCVISYIDTGTRLKQPGMFLYQSRFVTNFDHAKDINDYAMDVSFCFCHLVCWSRLKRNIMLIMYCNGDSETNNRISLIYL